MKKIYVVLVFLLIAALLITGCSPSQNSVQENTAGEGTSYDSEKDAAAGDGYAEKPEAMPAEEPAYDAPAAPEEGIGSDVIVGEDNGSSYDPDSVLQPSVNRKIIYHGTIEANTKEFKRDCDMIKSRLLDMGGYVESSFIKGKEPVDWQDTGRVAQMILRVPSKRFDEFITMLEGVGQNTYSSVSGEDISLHYFDRETKLKTLRNRQSRLEEMLKDPAYKLEAIIQLEQELAEVSYEIQTLETELRTYDSLVDFSKVEITLYEVMEIKTVTTPAEEDLGTRISNGFFSVLNALADFGEGLLIFFAAGSPIIIPIAVIVVLIIILVKRSKKRRAKALAASQAAYEKENRQ